MISQHGIFPTKKELMFYNSSEYTHSHWFRYAHGYKQAALMLIQNVKDAKTYSEVEDLIFPIIYLFRHFTELLLKQIIVEYADFKGTPKNIPTIHNLDLLWKDVETIINDLYFENAKKYSTKIKSAFSKKDLAKLTSIIKRLHTRDVKSDTFRYPINTSGEQTLKTDFNASLEKIVLEIDETFSFLASIPFIMFLYKHVP